MKNSLLGIHALYSTVIHETEHAKIGCEVWKDGYDSLLDTDKDGYRDGWELTDPTAIIFNFKIFKNQSQIQIILKMIDMIACMIHYY